MQKFDFLKKNKLERKYNRNIDILNNANVQQKIGLVLDLNFHLADRWVCALTPYLINKLINDFKCVIIQNQRDYNRFKNNLDVVISTHPGWSAPFIKYDMKKQKLKYIIYSDPHNSPEKYQRYFKENNFSYILAYYLNPTYFHFKDVAREKILHFTWAIPDEFVETGPIECQNQDYVMIFGGTKGEAYETRNWCRKYPFVKNFEYSGCENKALSNKKYFQWLQQFDATIAAGSLASIYRLVLPKYYEIVNAGCLLFAQEAEDLEVAGFKDSENCIFFNKQNFENKVKEYLNNKKQYLSIRHAGRKLILERHTLSKRIEWLKNHINANI